MRQVRADRRRAFTLVEVMIVIAIITILIGIVIIGTTHARAHILGSNAKQQMQILQSAIEKYTEDWPRWKLTSGDVIADKGWPDFVPGRLFAPPVNGGPYDVETGFNDHVTFDIEDGVSYDAGTGEMTVNTDGEVQHAGECLYYALNSRPNKPYVPEQVKASLAAVPVASGVQYPGKTGNPSGQARGLYVDPWGTPIRYFWVYKDVTGQARNGFLPVDFGAMYGNFTNPQFHQMNNVTYPLKIAAGYVLESAGPDKQFGNLWQQVTGSPTPQQEIDFKRAADNIIIKPD